MNKTIQNEITRIIKETEEILDDHYESAYAKERAMITAYTEIAELVKGEV